MTPWSVSAIAGMPNSAALATISVVRQAPSSSEYSLWACKWTKLPGMEPILQAQAGPNVCLSAHLLSLLRDAVDALANGRRPPVGSLEKVVDDRRVKTLSTHGIALGAPLSSEPAGADRSRRRADPALRRTDRAAPLASSERGERSERLLQAREPRAKRVLQDPRRPEQAAQPVDRGAQARRGRSFDR